MPINDPTNEPSQSYENGVNDTLMLIESMLTTDPMGNPIRSSRGYGDTLAYIRSQLERAEKK